MRWRCGVKKYTKYWYGVPPLTLLFLLYTCSVYYLVNNCRNVPASETEHLPLYYHFNQLSRADLKYLFVTGSIGSGMHQMRVLLDAHSQLACPSTEDAFRRVGNIEVGVTKIMEQTRLSMAGYTVDVLFSAFVAMKRALIFGSHIHRPLNSLYNCWSDNNFMTYHSQVLPFTNRSKVIVMVRDGRHLAVKQFRLNKKVSKSPIFLTSNLTAALSTWNSEVKLQVEECRKLTSSKCRVVHYENLMSQPKKVLYELSKFLDIRWELSWLHHHDLIGSEVKIYPNVDVADELLRPLCMRSIEDAQEIMSRKEFLGPLQSAVAIAGSEMLGQLGYLNGSMDLLIPDDTIESNERLLNSFHLRFSSQFWVSHSDGYLIRLKPYLIRLILYFF